ncbi:hypothetical protein HDV00_007972 [Rhizophlyctis rosea]|nr:hypothetical protein HDV00_007972 [Rhizophlyctis rosea]
MNGDVDPDGWQYSFQHNTQTWAGKPTISHYARRRRWIRMRKPVDVSPRTTSPRPSPSSPYPPDVGSPKNSLESKVGGWGRDVVRAMDGKMVDKERLEVVEKGVVEGKEGGVGREEVTSILAKFDHECYKLRAAKALVPVICGDEEVCGAVVAALRFWSDRIEFRRLIAEFRGSGI